MGFVLTLLYISFAYLSPVALFPELAQYRLQLILAICALLACVLDLPRSGFSRTPQFYLLMGLTATVATSNILASGWFGGTVPALQGFLPNALPLVLVGMTCKTLIRLRIICAVLVCIAVYYIGLGVRACTLQDFESVYIIMQGDLPRIRGLATVSDPNDLAQFIIISIPSVWLLWAHGIFGRVVALLLTGVFCCGIFLTHSRGAVIAIAAMLLFGLKDRLGAIASAALAGVLLILMKVLQVSGGRTMSDASSMERLSAWGAGLQMFKSSPLFGVGFNQFTENYERTAHNSFVLCLAELGAVGYFFWIALLVFTIVQLSRILHAAPDTVEPADEEQATGDKRAADVKRWAGALRISMVGFLVAGWFLSRTYTITLYMLLGMAIAVVRIAHRNESIQLQFPSLQVLTRKSALYCFLSVVGVYAMLRLRFLM